ncbi:hypothetical protein [Kineosporia succinea]|uniref:Uncharacterized protein n=1 Tax=Kineosporia succinea TaxID=84632 RepID=A0ABT9NWR9_9ACTN|nr:hypothetical protein [Kineosporia succinea]MDP9824869.1 hypothetical protein [Kineosporia succinea]
METIVVGYLAALAAGRARALPDLKLTQLLTQLYDSLVQRAPALRRLPGGGPQSVADAEHEVALALLDTRLKQSVQRALDDIEGHGGAVLLQPGLDIGSVRADRHGVAVGGRLQYIPGPADGSTVLTALRETKGLLRVAIMTGVLLTLGGLVSFALHVTLRPGGDPGIGLWLSWASFFLGLVLTGGGTLAHTSRSR